MTEMLFICRWNMEEKIKCSLYPQCGGKGNPSLFPTFSVPQLGLSRRYIFAPRVIGLQIAEL